MLYTLKIKQDTVFKQEVIDSSKLSAEKKISVKAGTEFTLLAYTDCDNSWKITLKDKTLTPPGSITNYNTWYIYKGHVILEDNRPKVEIPKGACFNVDGLKYPIYFDKPIIEGGNFKWSEAVHYNSTTGYYRKPTKEIVDNIIKMAKRMEWIRAELGNYPIIVTSWYRDPASNARAGGASKSYHLTGKAVDFLHSRLNPNQVRAKLKDKWVGGIEWGGIAWCHFDDGPNRDFNP